jgi:hypothetical protein
MSESHDGDKSHGGDMKAGFLGLIIGAVCLFAILFTIVRITHNHYVNEKPAAAQSAR